MSWWQVENLHKERWELLPLGAAPMKPQDSLLLDADEEEDAGASCQVSSVPPDSNSISMVLGAKASH